MKYSNIIGQAAAVLMAVACFFPWAYYPDLGMDFTGFFSKGNAYGKPGKLLLLLAFLNIVLFLIPKIWAKRFNLVVAVVGVSYSIKSFILFSSCYGGICPQTKPALYLMLISSIVIFIMSLIPDLRLKNNQPG